MQKSYHNRILETKVLGFSQSFVKYLDDEVVPEQLTGVVAVTFMPHDIRKHIKDIQVTGSLWVSQTLGRAIYELLLSMQERLLQERILRQRYT